MSSLPRSSFVPTTTRRLHKPDVLWSPEGKATPEAGIGEFYCLPADPGHDKLFDDATRTEFSDRYGGVGTGRGGGSGRCSMHEGLQTKGVGRTALVDPKADPYHASGLMPLEEACQEAIFSSVYDAALPYGSVPARAVIATGEQFRDPATGEMRPRALVLRDFVPRPAHFLRNPYFVDAAQPDLSGSGWSQDAVRCMGAMSVLASEFRTCFPDLSSAVSDAHAIDSGLRELTRRLAWQAAASYAMRLPHGALSCSNVGLSGAFLDFGVASFIPAYRRLARPPLWQESATGVHQLCRTLISLRQQMRSYLDGNVCAEIVTADVLAGRFYAEYEHRLGIEMVKMSGMTEDLALTVPRELVAPWVAAALEIAKRGADEAFVAYPGSNVGGRRTPHPHSVGRYDLSSVLARTGGITSGYKLDEALAPQLEDQALRQKYVRTSISLFDHVVRATGFDASIVERYFSCQAVRKNASLECLYRPRTRELLMKAESDPRRAKCIIDDCASKARIILSDLDPEIDARTGASQLAATRSQTTWSLT